MEDEFNESSMGAGLLLYESDSDWMYIEKAQQATNSRIRVVVCQGGTSAPVADLDWTRYSGAHLRMDRNSTGVWFYASADGASYELVYHHSEGTSLDDKLAIGPFIYSLPQQPGRGVRPLHCGAPRGARDRGQGQARQLDPALGRFLGGLVGGHGRIRPDHPGRRRAGTSSTRSR